MTNRDSRPALTIATEAQRGAKACAGFKVNKRIQRRDIEYMFGGGEEYLFGVRYAGKRFVVSVQEVEE